MRQAGLGTALWLEEDMNLEKEKGEDKKQPIEKKERAPRKSAKEK
jgi:hypothetical protein